MFSVGKGKCPFTWLRGRLHFNLWVVVGMILLSVILGVLNNLRVYEEQKVEIFGEVRLAEDMDGEDGNPEIQSEQEKQ